MIKIITILVASATIAGCSTLQSGVEKIQTYWPKDHDPVMFEKALKVAVSIDQLNCDQPEFGTVISDASFLAKYAELRKDPQSDNLKGLHQHLEKLKANPKKVFCELGKTTAKQRINITVTTWSKR